MKRSPSDWLIANLFLLPHKKLKQYQWHTLLIYTGASITHRLRIRFRFVLRLVQIHDMTFTDAQCWRCSTRFALK